MRWFAGIAVALVIAGFGAYQYRAEFFLHGAGLLNDWRNPVGPTQEIVWDRADAVQAPAPGDQRPPNIVLIVADDLGWNDLTFGGGGVAGGSVPTPNIDSIASDGVTFTNGYSASGTCAPSRAALMSGRYPTRFGFEFTPTPGPMQRILMSISPRQEGVPSSISHFDDPTREAVPYTQMGMPTEELSLAERLKDQGYHTVHIGKWHLGTENGMNAHEQGFDESLLMASGGYLPEDDPNVVNSKQPFDPIDRFLWSFMRHASSFNNGELFQPRGYITDYYTEEAVKVIEANKERPFFLYLAHWAPHTPLQATKADYDALSHIDDHRLRVYAAMIRALDRGVGQVLDALKANGLDENTLVMFTSDNGGAGYVGLDGLNDPYRGWKITFFEGGIHVPYFMKWPGKVAPGTVYDKPVHHFDIHATAAAAGGASPLTDRKMDGVDLAPFVAPELAAPQAATITEEPLTTEAPHEALFWRGGNYQVVISGGWKFQRNDAPVKQWLFDLATDPTEQKNIADARPDKVAEMEALLAAHNAEQAEPAWPAMVEAVTRVDKTLDKPWSQDDEFIYWPN
jgi:arylsulfatase A-like enzyme